MSFIALRTAIKTKLDTCSKLQAVLNYHEKKLTGYPAATFEPDDLSQATFDYADNLREYRFRIVLHQEIEKKGRQEAVRILAGAVDQVIDAFDADDTLGGVAHMSEISPVRFGTYTEGAGTVLFADIMLTCKIEKTVIT